jgi:hypothetical protein
LKNNIPGHGWMLRFLKRHPAEIARFASNIKGSRAVITTETLREYISFLTKELEGVNPANIWNFNKTNHIMIAVKKKASDRRGVKYPENIRNSSKRSVSLLLRKRNRITSVSLCTL